MQSSLRRGGTLLTLTTIAAVGLGFGTAAGQGGSDRKLADVPVLSPLYDANGLGWDLAKKFRFDWQSVALSAKNTKGGDPRASVRVLTVSVGLGFIDVNHPAGFMPGQVVAPEGLVTIDVNSPQIMEALDEAGTPVDCQAAYPAEHRQYQKSGWYWAVGTTFAPPKLTPFEVRIRLTGSSGQPIPSALSRVTGYIYALYADKVVEVDLPFDPNAPCLYPEMTPGLVFCVDRGMPMCPPPIVGSRGATPVALYRYTTYVKSTEGKAVLGMCDGDCFKRSLYLFGDYAVVRTELYDTKHKYKYVAILSTEGVGGDPSGKRGALCWGEGPQEGSDAYDTIGHIIAVHPVEVKIPFVLTNIPVPKP
jgi:hypothetical protein